MSKSKKLKLLKKNDTPGTEISAITTESELLFETIDTIAAPVLVIDSDNTILVVNTSAQQLFRGTQEAIIQQPVQKLLPDWLYSP